MSIYRLRRRVKQLGTMVLALGFMVVVLGGVMLVNRAKDAESVSDALAVATIADYANLEATRVAKMAGMLMGMGGQYTASCDAVYNATTGKTETEYSITWYREEPETTRVVDDNISICSTRPKIKRTWRAASWRECIAKMNAWKRGE